MSSDTIGIGLSLLGGVLVGNCMLPLRKIRTWAWECSWLVFSIVSLVLVPCLLAWLPHWPSFYFSVSTSDLLPPFLFGVGWGVAQVLFGLAMVRLGMALGFTLVVGLGTVFGTLIPFFVRHEADLLSRSSATLL
jgi:L-rhamnose-H+ transport protein